MMHLNGLPADLAQFVQDVLASGQYQSAEALVCEALHALREHAHSHGAPLHSDEAHPESPPQSADAYVQLCLAGECATAGPL